MSLRPVCRLYPHLPAKDFGPIALKNVRQLMIDGYEHPDSGRQPALARPTVNKRVGWIKRVWKWAAAEELLPESIFRALATVEGLRRGRTTARDTRPVKPVAIPFVEQTLEHLLPQVAAMVELQLQAGMRPGEVIIMRTVDLDTSGKVWLYSARQRPGTARPAQERLAGARSRHCPWSRGAGNPKALASL
jgi:integrase